MNPIRFIPVAALATIACSTPDAEFKALKPDIAVAPGSIDFGRVVKLYEVTFEVQVLNAGRAPLEIDEITLQEHTGGEGVFVLEGGAEEVDSGDSTSLKITFNPAEYLDYAADLVILSNDEDQPEFRIPVTGTGTIGSTPDIHLEPGSVTFAGVASTETSGGFFTIKNKGDGPLHILDVAPVGDDFFTLVTDPDGLEIASGAEYTVVAQYSPTDGASGHTGGLIITSTDPDEAETEVVFIGGDGGDGYDFPVAIADCAGGGIVNPPDVIIMDGTESYDPKNDDGSRPVTFQWTLLSLPEISASVLDNDTDGAFEFVIDVAGDYDFQLVVTDSAGVDSEPTTCRVQAIPAEELYVAVSWDTGNSDVDLHMVPQGETFFGAGDCYYANPSPARWDTEGYGSPIYALDNQTGYGPENINVDDPVDMKYYIRVHYWADRGGGDTKATVSIYVNGELLETVTGDLTNDDRWNVGYVDMTGGVGVFTEEGTIADKDDSVFD
jgi:hypothetical protein